MRKRLTNRPQIGRRTLIGFSLLLTLTALPGAYATPVQPLRLWYRQPAAVWNEALPIGNGRLGAMVFAAFKPNKFS
jgi:alpha-L-fucosidase 2